MYRSNNKTKSSKNKSKSSKSKSKSKSSKNKTTKCYSFCKNHYVKHVNHDFKEYTNKQQKLMFDECKNIYCSDDCLKQYIKNLGLDEKDTNNFLIKNYKKRLDNNFLTDIDKTYTNPKKYKQELIKKGATSSCFSLSKNYYNPLQK